MNLKGCLSEMYVRRRTVYMVLQIWNYGLNCVLTITDVRLPVEKGTCRSLHATFRRQVLVVYMYYGFLHPLTPVIISVFIFISPTTRCIVKCN